MNEWSTYFQNTDFMEQSRLMILNRDAAGYVAEKVGLRPGLRVLDVGCGTGEFTFYLSGQCAGVAFSGIDMDENFIAAARKKAESTLSENTFSFTIGDALALPYEDDAFDVVLSHTFLTSVFDYAGALREMKRVCRPGGVIASVTVDTFRYAGGSQGHYPASYRWLGEYRRLREKVQQMCETLKPASSFAVGADTAQLPRVFSEMKLEDVSVYPLGKFFSLSNHALSNETKERFIRLEYSAEMKRLEAFSALPEAEDYLSAAERSRYQALLALRRDALLADIGENRVWDWTGGCNLLVVGKNPAQAAEAAPRSEYERSKFKVCPPSETVDRLKHILRSVDFEPEELDIQSGVGSVCSLRVSLKHTDIGQNGKGASAAYARASGYAEVMERLQTGFLFQHSFDEATAHWGGFRAGPDEVPASAAELKALGGTLLEGSIRAIIRASGGLDFLPVDAAEYMSLWDFAAEDGKFAALPFVRMTDGQTEYLPDCLYRAFYFTNGSCAGNSRAEALVQGMSEIAERWAAEHILTGKLTPPIIPDEFIAQFPPLAEMVTEFRAHSQYALRIMDASCGVGLPVICAAVIDRRSGAVTLRLGAHPRFETALERTLTEILQGRHIETLRGAPRYDLKLDGYSQSIVNRFNFLKDATGVFPSNLFASQPSWEYKPFASAPEDADGQLAYMLELYRQLGWTPYVRDCSFLGFPSYHVVVPGESMAFNFGAERLTEKKLAAAVQPTLRNMAAATEEARARAMKYANLKAGWAYENTYGYMAGLPYAPKLLGFPLDARLMLAMYALHRQDYGEAGKILELYAFDAAGAATDAHVLRQLVRAKQQGGDMAQAAAFLRVLFAPERVDKALEILEDPLDALPKLDCYHCEKCPVKGRCKMVYAAPVMRKIREKMRAGRR